MLHIHRSERADGLVTMLGEVLAEPLADVMTREVVAVPTRGIERWLTQQLSGVLGSSPGRSDGACANFDFPFPGRLVGDAVAAACGIAPESDPWSPDRSVWHLLELVHGHLDEPWLFALAAHLRKSAPDGEARRYAAMRHVADLYDRYAVHRPEMLLGWTAGDEELEPEDRWQAELWRLLRSRLGTPSPAERVADACAALGRDRDLVELPQRLAVFGVTRLAASYLDVLGALSVHRDVHLFLLHPSPRLWTRVEALGQPERPLRRRDELTAGLTENPLLSSWGQDAREMQLVLGAASVAREDHHRLVDDESSSLLGRIQSDVRADRAPAGPPRRGEPDERPLLDDSDDSITIHACHGRARQVEVLRATILHLFEQQPDLEPRDVIVMCPDIETYAPLIQAAFGAVGYDDGDPASDASASDGAGGGGSDLRVRLADRSLRQTNLVLGAVASLLDLASARVTASEVLDFTSREPVRHRFGFDQDDLARIEDWVDSAGIRWGFDAPHRAPFKLDGLEANSWRAGLDRILLGVTMADEDQRRFGAVVPLDDIDSADIDLVGRLAELIDRLQAALEMLAGPQTLRDWTVAVASAARSLTATSESESWQTIQLQRLLEDVVDEATTDGAVSSTLITLGDMRALLADRLKGRPTRANFRTGHLTICTLVPMRSVPHRVVCLLGLDDGAFPRHTRRDGDNLILGDPHVGDRDARTEDRQLLLDAVLAATDHLVITYTGRDERTNLPRPPAVPVAELLDVIDRTVRTERGSARQRVVVSHPLQPFDGRNFLPGELGATGAWSFDRVNLGGARALQTRPAERRSFLVEPLSPLELTSLELADFERFATHPTRAFLRRRLKVSLYQRSREVADALPLSLDALESWGIGERMLTARLAGAGIEDCVAAERGRGQLPPGALGEPVLESISQAVESIASALPTAIDPVSLDVNVTLGDGTVIVGTVAGIEGDVVRSISYSRLGPSQRLKAWLRLLALSAARPDRPFEAVTVGKPMAGSSTRVRVSTSHIGPLGIDPESRRATALAQLDVLVDLYRRAMREPLPLYTKTSAAYAETAFSDEGDPAAEAAQQWTSTRDFSEFSKEDSDPEHRLVLGGVITLDDILAEAPRPDEQGEGWFEPDPSRFARYAKRLWFGVLRHEVVTHQ